MTESYYDQLAPYYQFIYQDWEKSINKQAAILQEIIREFFDENTHTILDAACGIGTQTIGLAQLGFNLTASDISGEAIERAGEESKKRNLAIEFRKGDMRNLWDIHKQEFDLVIACDNAVPHLLNDNAILEAFQQFHRCARAGGGCLISVRDYAELGCTGTQIHPRQIHETENGRVILFDIWDFHDDRYKLTTYLVEDFGNQTAKAQVMTGGQYYCIPLLRLEELLAKAGFKNVKTIRDRFFQPLVVGYKA